MEIVTHFNFEVCYNSMKFKSGTGKLYHQLRRQNLG